MSTSRPRLVLVLVAIAALAAAAACSHSHRVTPPSRPATTVPLVDGPRDGLLIPAPLRLVAAYHDDTWRFAGYVRFGPTVAGRAPAWDDQWLYLVDPTTGTITASIALAGDEDLTAVAVDATGTQLAGLRRDGTALHWPTLTAAPTHLTPRSLDIVDELATIDAFASSPYAHPGGLEPYRPDLRAGREDAWALSRSAQRLAFSPDGTRLVAGMHLYDLADRRDLLPLRPDEIALDLDATAAIVARFIIARYHGEPGSQCGFVPTWSVLRLAALDYRTIDAAPIPFPQPTPGLPHDAAVARREVAFPTAYLRLPPFTSSTAPASSALPASTSTTARPSTPDILDPRLPDPITAIDIADDRRLAYVTAQHGWLAHDRLATDLRLPDHLDRSRFQAVALGTDAIFAVVSHFHRGGAAPTSAYAFDATGAARIAVPGSTFWITRSGHSVLRRNHGSADLWHLADPLAEPTRTSLAFTPTNLHAIDQGRAAALGTRVVLRDSDRTHSLYLVRDLPAAASGTRLRTRTLRVRRGFDTHWALSDDGTTLAVAGDHTVHVFALDAPADDAPADDAALDAPADLPTAPHLTADLPGHVAALAISSRIVVAADDRGHVALWRDGHRLDLDLTGRHDRATALAISPDQRLLAIGTGRGRVFVIALDE